MKTNIWLKLNALLTAFLALTVLYFFLWRDSEKIVYVNANKILLEYKGMQEAQEKYNTKTALWKSQVDTLETELQQAFAAYEKEKTSLSASEKQKREQIIKNKEVQLVQFSNALQQNRQKEEQRLQQEVLVKVNSFLAEYGKEHGYSIIMAATTMGNIVYAEEGRDITEEVLEGLNAAYVD
jgi:outer membrane protein